MKLIILMLVIVFTTSCSTLTKTNVVKKQLNNNALI
jgi:hypothetical protein